MTRNLFRLSILQLLVAIAATAIVVQLNTSESKGPALYGDEIYLAGIGSMTEVDCSKGWPFVYSKRRVFDWNERARRMTKNELRMSGFEAILRSEKISTDRSALVANSIVGFVVAACSMLAVSVLARIVAAATRLRPWYMICPWCSARAWI